MLDCRWASDDFWFLRHLRNWILDENSAESTLLELVLQFQSEITPSLSQCYTVTAFSGNSRVVFFFFLNVCVCSDLQPYTRLSPVWDVVILITAVPLGVGLKSDTPFWLSMVKL